MTAAISSDEELLGRLSELGSLHRAWEHVRRAGGIAGADRQDAGRFDETADERLGDLARGQLVPLLESLEELTDARSDRVRLYRLCAACQGEILSVGATTAEPTADVWIV